MNRIVIIGNGFDLAHGLKTSYADFVLDLINSDFEVFRMQVRQPKHELFYFEIFPSPNSNPIDLNKIEPLSNLNHKYRRFNADWRLDTKFPDQYRRLDGFTVDWKNGDKVSIVIQSELFFQILKQNGWADIEKEYYDRLVLCFQKNERSNLHRLNIDFLKLKMQLTKYLIKINQIKAKKNASIEQLLLKCEKNQEAIYNSLNHPTKQRVFKEIEYSELENVVFLNFNYTTTLSKMYSINIMREIPIHGSVLDLESIIFGYGDEKSEYHEKLESVGDDDWILNFKSHYYGARGHYSHLLNILESDIFDVVVIGHSLGLSDRLMLQTIFEHEKCQFIQLCHTGGDSHFRKRIAISRHFNDKKLMRSRLLEENESLKFNRTPN